MLKRIEKFFTIAILYLFCRRKCITYKKLINYEKSKTKIGAAILIVFLIIAVGMCGLYLAGLICYKNNTHLTGNKYGKKFLFPLTFSLQYQRAIPASAQAFRDFLLCFHKGYSATRTSDIANAVGMSEGLLYHYFETKEKLYLALLQIAYISQEKCQYSPFNANI